MIKKLTCQVVCITVMISHVFISLSAVQRCDYAVYSFVFFTMYGGITNSQCDQVPVCLVAQMVEHCINIADVLGSNPFQALTLQLFSCLSVMISHILISSQQYACIHGYVLFIHIFICTMSTIRPLLTPTNYRFNNPTMN